MDELSYQFSSVLSFLRQSLLLLFGPYFSTSDLVLVEVEPKAFCFWVTGFSCLPKQYLNFTV